MAAVAAMTILSACATGVGDTASPQDVPAVHDFETASGAEIYRLGTSRAVALPPEGRTAAAYWCAMGQFAVEELGLPRETELRRQTRQRRGPFVPGPDGEIRELPDPVVLFRPGTVPGNLFDYAPVFGTETVDPVFGDQPRTRTVGAALDGC